jgi:hypothetical protein
LKRRPTDEEMGGAPFQGRRGVRPEHGDVDRLEPLIFCCATFEIRGF